MKRFNKMTALIVGSLLLSACTSEGPSTGEGQVLPMSTMDVNLYSLQNLVCDPMGGDGPDGFDQGVKAELFWLNPDQPRYNDVQSYIDHGQKSSKDIFFSTIDVPTRLFSQGFPTETGDLLKDDAGNTLNEYFALRLTSVLKLSPDQEEGDYQLALLSDDGAIMRVRDENGQYQVVVDNDGDHPTRFGCGSVIHMTRESEVVVQFDYYQGPRYHIAMIPMWRKVSGTPPAESMCGKLGNLYWFDYNNGQKPLQPYLTLLERGWTPIKKANYELPQSALFNPCVGLDSPKISGFSVSYSGDGSVRVNWQTDIPATSQVLYTNLTTSEVGMTKSDNVLRTSHEVVVGPLSQGNIYSLQAVSISENFGKAISAPLELSF